MKVCHVTSVHKSDDVRIFVKECSSLAAHGYDTYLVAPGESREQNGVQVKGVGEKPLSRIKRMIWFRKRVCDEALKLDCDVYHFHDPELLPFGLKMKRRGGKVIYDSHEDVPGQILDKEWIAAPLRNAISGMFRKYETHVTRRIDAVVAATPHIAEKFAGRAKRVAAVNNYPKLNDIIYHQTPMADRKAVVCYAGGISENRGEAIMKEAMLGIKGSLLIAGDHEIEAQGNVKYIGRLDRAGINDLYGKAVVGLCILKPIENYYYSQPIKMYEYMAAGIPFVCSDFPGWRVVAEASRGGICVDPTDIEAIRDAVNGLLADRAKAEEMGRCGHDYVIANCTWENEEKTLLSLYSTLGEVR